MRSARATIWLTFLGLGPCALTACRPTPPAAVQPVAEPKIFRPERYGARCDANGAAGAGADDARGLQAALDAAKAAHGTMVITGSCRTTKTLRLSAASDVVIAGGGTGRIVFDGPEIGLAITDGSTNVVLDGLGVIGHSISEGIVIRDSSFVRVARCDVSGATMRPKSISPPYAAGVLVSSSDDVTIENNHFHGNGASVEDCGGADILTSSAGRRHRRLVIVGNRAASTATGQNITLFDTSYSRIVGNIVSGASWLNSNHLSGGYGILAYRTTTPGAESGRNVVESNVVLDTAGTGIFMQGQPGSTVANNVVTSVALRQLHEALSNGCIAVESDPEGPGITVTGNNVAECGIPRKPWPVWTVDAVYPRGSIVQAANRYWHSLRSENVGHPTTDVEWWSEIRAGGIEAFGRGNTIVGNTIQGTAGAGIALRDAHEGTIASNVVRSAGTQGIMCGGTPTCEGVIVSSNQITDNARFGDGSAYGITGPFGHSSITGNVLHRIGGVGITNAGGGDGDVFANNIVLDSGLKAAAYPAIHLFGGSGHVVSWNKIASGGAKLHSRDCFADASQSSSFYGNDCTLESPGAVAIAPLGPPRSVPGTAPPKTGSWSVGDRVLNSKPATGQPPAWICTSSGTPGTWLPITKLQ